MNDDKPRDFIVAEGDTLFFPRPERLEDLRRATRGGLLAGESPRPFRVMAECHFYFWGSIQGLLWDSEELERILDEHGSANLGETGGALNCVAIWEREHRFGLLAHRSPEGLCFAYLPVITLRAAAMERDIARRIDEIADLAGGVMVYGQDECVALDELLRGLSRQLDA